MKSKEEIKEELLCAIEGLESWDIASKINELEDILMKCGEEENIAELEACIERIGEMKAEYEIDGDYDCEVAKSVEELKNLLTCDEYAL